MKKIKFKLKAILQPKNINPSQGIGPILGQYGINLLEFCNKFNLLTKNINTKNVNLKILIFEDNNYEIIIKNYNFSNYIKEKKNIEKFSKKTKHDFLEKISFNEIKEIAISRILYEKINILSLQKMIIGTLLSMGFTI